MSRGRGRRGGYYGYPRFRSSPKKPPPERGIKLQQSGATWWGRRWIEALEGVSSGYSSRLARGKTYARAGRCHDLMVEAGEATAHVTGTRSRPYRITIRLEALDDATWTRAIKAMSREARFSAELLAGRMPEDIDAAFQEDGASLFPEDERDLATGCSCPDWANPCKHVAATHYILGEALDRDPFLLFELRGRTKEQVLEALRTARSSPRRGRTKGVTPAPDPAPMLVEDIPRVSLGRLRREDYDKPPEPLPSLNLAFEAPPASTDFLRQLGAPPSWRDDRTPSELFGPLIHAAAERARKLALSDPEPAGEVPPAPKPASGKTSTARKKTTATNRATKKKVSKKPPRRAGAGRRKK
jgi:uncharacterized Zn finger protein